MQSSSMLSERTDARFLAILIMLVLSCTLYDICACIQEIKNTHPSLAEKSNYKKFTQSSQVMFFFFHNWQLVSSGVTLIVMTKEDTNTSLNSCRPNWSHLTCYSSSSHPYSPVVEVHCTCIENLNRVEEKPTEEMLNVSQAMKFKCSLPINKVYCLGFQLFCTVQICKDKGISNIFYWEATTQSFFTHDLQPFQCILPKRKT